MDNKFIKDDQIIYFSNPPCDWGESDFRSVEYYGDPNVAIEWLKEYYINNPEEL